MMHRTRSLLVATLLLSANSLLSSLPAYSQDAPDVAGGITPGMVYNIENIDSVDMVSDLLNVHIPLLVDHSQRGKLNFTYEVSGGGSASWYVNCTDPSTDTGCAWYEASMAGGGLAFEANGVLITGGASYRDCCYGNAGVYNTFRVQLARDRSGASHQLGTVTTSPYVAESIDGSGIREVLTSTAYVLTNKDGVQFSIIGLQAPFGFLVEDPNGNEMTTSPASPNTAGAEFGLFPFGANGSSNSTTTDTLGRTWSWTGTTDVSSCPVAAVNAYVWSTPGFNGGARNFKFCQGNVPIATNFHLLLGSTYVTEKTWTATMLTGIVLPDGTTWRFDYTSYGDVSKIYLPTGGTISYGWTTVDDIWGSAGNMGIDRERVLSSRTVNDGTNHNWTYSQTNYGATTTVTDPLQNDTVYTGSSGCTGQISQIQYYSGTGSNRTLLKTVTKNFQPLSDPYPDEIVGLSSPCLPLNTVTTLPNGQVNEVSQVSYTYDSGFSFKDTNLYAVDGPGPFTGLYGLQQSESHTDWGTGSAGPVLSTTNTNYLYSSNSSYVTANILDLPSSVITSNGSGYKCAETDYGYDVAAQIVSSGVTEKHVAAPSPGILGNLTSVTRQLSSTPCQSGASWSSLPPTNNYVYDTGMLQKSVDPRSNPTTYSYSGTYYGAYPTTVTNALGQQTNYTFDFKTGLVTAIQNPNDLANSRSGTTYTYDDMLRPLIVIYPDGGETTVGYNYSGTVFVGDTATKLATPDPSIVTTQVFDGLGRLKQTQLTSDPAGTDYTDTTYDANGRIFSVSNPYRSTSDTTYGLTKTYYDALNRVTSVVKQDGSTVSINYASFPCTTVTDEAGKMRKSCADGLGRMTGVWEDPNGLNYPTSYTYDALDNLLSVAQNGSRQRTFTYDSLARLISATNPESGTINYTYDANGNMNSKTAPKPNQTSASVTVVTSYLYDPLNRLTKKSYNDGTTPTVNFGYDSVPPTGCSPNLTIVNGIGMRTGMCDVGGSEAWSYDSMGRVAVDQRTTNGITKSITYSSSSYPYDLDGSITQLIYPSGRAITYTSNGAAQTVSAVDTPDSINYATLASYLSHGALSSLLNGSNIISTWYYNNRLQPCRIAVNSSGSAPTQCADSTNSGNVLDFAYSFNSGSSDNGNVGGIANNRDSTRSQTFGYDSLNRLLTAQTNSTYSTSPTHCWGESYVYDNQPGGGAWGNLTNINAVSTAYNQCTQENPSLSVNAKNHILNLQGNDVYYDSAGNMTTLPSGISVTYDAEGRITTINGSGYVYDGDGKRVEKTVGSAAYKIYWYGLNNSPLAETDGSGNTTDEYIFFNGKRIAHRVGP